MMRKTIQVAMYLLLASAMAACNDKGSKPIAASADTLLFSPPPLAIAVSHFDVPLDYNFAPVMQIVERTVPKTFGSLDELHVVGTDSGKHYAYTATRGPFTAVADGPVVRLRTTLSYAARGWYKPPIGPTLSAGCGNDEERPRITVELAAPLTLGADWHLISKARLSRLEPASSDSKDRCAVGVIHYDVTERVLDAARRGLTSQLPKIDRKVAGVDLTHLAEGWWRLLNKPIRLTDSVWLMLHPEQLRLGKITGNGDVLTVRAGLDAKPTIVTGHQPRDTAPPLPPLAHDTVSHGYHILLDGLVDYATASRGITAAAQGKTFTKGGQTVRIASVEVAPTPEGRLVLTVHFTGDTDGRLLLVGSLKYDSKRGVMTVPDLDYDLSTSNQVVNAYVWLRSDALRTQLREIANVSAQPALERGKSLLLIGLNRKLGDDATLSGTVDSVAVRGVYVTRAGLLARAEAVGNAHMSVRQHQRQPNTGDH